MRLGPAAVRAGDLLCLSALYAADADGAFRRRDTAGLNISGRRRITRCGRSSQLPAILPRRWRLALKSPAGQSLRERFQCRLSGVARLARALAGKPIPFGAVRMPAPMPVPGCNIVADMWVYLP